MSTSYYQYSSIILVLLYVSSVLLVRGSSSTIYQITLCVSILCIICIPYNFCMYGYYVPYYCVYVPYDLCMCPVLLYLRPVFLVYDYIIYYLCSFPY